MGVNSIRISRLDAKFSRLVRGKAKGRCEYCLKPKRLAELQNSHFKGRRAKTVRWDLSNCAALCFGCHKYLGENPHEHVDFFKKRLGEKGYQALIVQARVGRKPDQKLIELAIDQELKKIA